MRETKIDQDGVQIHARVDGVDHRLAPTVVFANSLGTTLNLWQKIAAHTVTGNPATLHQKDRAIGQLQRRQNIKASSAFEYAVV